MSIRLLADENFDRDIVRGLLRREPQLDLLRAQDVGLRSVPDPQVLEWAANKNRILLTHDFATIVRFAYERVARGEKMPGVIEVKFSVPIGSVIDDILLFVTCSAQGEWEGQVLYLPLR